MASAVVFSELTALGTKAGQQGIRHPGEAVLWTQLERGRTVAVDLGGNQLMGAAVADEKPDVLVLTHDDADHIGGFAAFADATDPARGIHLELWVPAEWGLLVLLAAQIAAGAASGPSPITEPELIRFYRRVLVPVDPGSTPDQVAPPPDFNLDASRIQAAFPKLRRRGRIRTPSEELLDEQMREQVRLDRGRHRTGTPGAIARRASSSVSKLTEILATASSRGWRLRFFSTDHADQTRDTPWRTQGRQGLATLPNAREVTLQPDPTGNPLGFLAAATYLSVQNRRALTVLLWNGANPADGQVMVWSDSSGEWIAGTALPPNQYVAATTVPHHGSTNEAHENVWNVLRMLPANVPFVLAGGHQLQVGVNRHYRARAAATRCCTRCRHENPPGMPADVVLTVQTGMVGCLQRTCRN